jgi:hypothetical protein
MCYNGHENYDKWNAALWVSDSEYLYLAACQGSEAEAAEHILAVYPVTGDGVDMTPELALYAVRCARGVA